ncbi:LINE-1 reverse transcriptase homolog [Linum perenne]
MYEAVQFQLSGPLCVLGDFNAIVSPDEGSNVTGYTASMREFGDWINDNNLLDHRVIGPLYTWHNNRLDGIIYRRLDRCLVNLSWTSIFPGSVVELLAPGFSDHCGVLLNTDMNVASLPKSFKFFNCWIQNKDYDKIVAEAWERVNVVDPNNGFHRVYAKLKEVKNALKQLNKDQFSDVSRRVIEAEENLKAAQMALLTSSGLVDVEEVKVCKGKWIELRNAEESLYRQKSRENWLKLGDSNTAYFHRAVKIKQVKKQIGYLELSNGAISSNMGEITQEIVSYYMNLLGKSDPQVRKVSGAELDQLIMKKLSSDKAEKLTSVVTVAEIKDAMFSISGNKSPGPDGFGSSFYKHSWDIVGGDICQAVSQFFATGSLHRSVNSTILSLIPKKINAVNIKDYRPIACCNVLYKCIAKVLATRIASCLPEVISSSQSAFVKGRSIGDNILMAHELVNGYHLKHISPRCAIKIDLRKAFDSVDLSYVLMVMTAMGFPAQFIKWINGCLSSVMISVGVNGGSVGYFKGVKGVRQGDPLSPALFVISMEVLHCLFHRASIEKRIPFHPKCKKLAIINLSFADDLMVFTNGTLDGVLGIFKVLQDFYSVSGLQLNPEKTEIFFSRSVTQQTREEIVNHTGFAEGSLPVRYLGVPLVSGKIKAKDCEVLLEKITAKISGWRVQTLSYAGRLQLVKSVLATMSQYWMTIFLLPTSIIKAVEKLCSDFLWKVSDGNHKRAKVAWKYITFPFDEGGLEIRDMSIWNTSCVIRHIWSILASAGSIWVAWIKAYRLQNKTIWSCEGKPYHSWFWRRILKVRCFSIDRFTIDEEGEVNWCGKNMAKYSVADVYDALCVKQTRVLWGELIWAQPRIPKHCFMGWLAVNKRLVTREVMSHWGVTVDISCLLCDDGVDDIQHIMVSCSFSHAVQQLLFGKATTASTWEQEVGLSAGLFAGNSSVAKKSRLLWRAWVSSVWYERCRRNAGEKPRPPEDVFSVIKFECDSMQ